MCYLWQRRTSPWQRRTSPWQKRTLPWRGRAQPEMARVKLPSIHYSYHAAPSPPLTPPAESVGYNFNSGSGLSRRSSEDYVSAETLVSIASSASTLVSLGSPPDFDFGSRRGSTSSSVTLGSDSTSERLPSFSEVAKDVPPAYTQWRADPNTVGLPPRPFPGNYGHGGSLTPLPSPTCSSNGGFCFSDAKHNVPWSRAQIPSEHGTHHFDDKPTQLASLPEINCESRVKLQSIADRRRLRASTMKAYRFSISKSTKSGVPTSANKKRVNQSYLGIQQAFIIYHKVDLGLQWAKVKEEYIKWFPNDPQRTEGGVQCIFYRTNANIPQQTPDKFLVLRYDYEEVEGMDVDRSEQTGEKEDDEVKDRAMPYNIHGFGNVPTVEYRTAHIKVREGGVSLLERFPEVLVDEGNEWVKPEHREMARELAERRLQQRREWREWMRKFHPERLRLVDNPPSKGAANKRKPRACKNYEKLMK